VVKKSKHKNIISEESFTKVREDRGVKILMLKNRVYRENGGVEFFSKCQTLMNAHR
jgi:hypothetical protein